MLGGNRQLDFRRNERKRTEEREPPMKHGLNTDEEGVVKIRLFMALDSRLRTNNGRDNGGTSPLCDSLDPLALNLQ